MKINEVCQRLLPVLLGMLVFGGRSSAQEQLTGQRKQFFSNDWQFSPGDDTIGREIAPGTKRWKRLDLPHDWSIQGNMDASNPMGNDGGYFPAGVGWYHKNFVVAEKDRGRRISIYFEGVYMGAEVFVNGVSLGVQPYGYTSFSRDLTSHLIYGGENKIDVRVDNSQQKNSRWYSGSGIYRHVWLINTGDVNIIQWGLFVTSTAVSQESALVDIKTVIKNDAVRPRKLTIETAVYDKEKKKVGTHTVSTKIDGLSQKELVQRIKIHKPRLWDIVTPDLYTTQVTIKENDQMLDTKTEIFGIRSLQFSVERGFELNGKTIKLNGGCVHHDNGCLGAAAFDRAEVRKVELLKRNGFNAVRTSHNPPSEAFLDACDRYGLLVIDESFDGWRVQKNKFDYSIYFDEWAKRDVQAMVLRDRNHPSVIMWSTGNEIIERKEPGAVETARQLAGFVKEIDPTRPVTSAMTTWDKSWELFDPLMAAHDVAGYNYQLHRAEGDHQRVPSRIILQTESYPKDAFANWQLVQKHKYILGDFVWTALDYLGESGIGRYYYPGEPPGQHWERNLFPWHGAYCGDIDLTGWRKPIAHYRSMLYNSNEKIYLAVKEPNPGSGEIKLTDWAVWPTWESWTWTGWEGKKLEVEVYSRYPSVRLYLDSTLIGEKASTEAQQFKAVFPVPYQPGVLKAVGVENGKETEAVRLRTAGPPARILLKPDRDSITANGQDLSFVTVEVADIHGNLCAGAANNLTFSVEGAGSIAGIDNANLKDSTAYNASVRKAWNGRAMVVVRSSKTKGQINLVVASPGLPDTKMAIITMH